MVNYCFIFSIVIFNSVFLIEIFRLTGNESRSIEEPALSDAESDRSTTSPLIKAERELQKLQKSQDLPSRYSPSSQKKFYGSDVSYLGRHTTDYEFSKKVIPSPKYSAKNPSYISTSPKQKGGRVTSTPKRENRENKSRAENGRLPRTPPRIQIQPKKYSSPTRFDVEVDQRSKHDGQKGLKLVADGSSYQTKSSKDRLSDSKSPSPSRSPGKWFSFSAQVLVVRR